MEHPSIQGATSARNANRGPNAGRIRRPDELNYLLKSSYRAISVQKLLGMTDEEARTLFERVRWGQHGVNRQVCPKCGTIEQHFWCPAPKRWKCRAKACGHQFTVLQGTRLHGSKKSYQELLALLFEFVEGKDSVSARQLGGKYDIAYHTAYVLLMKVREAIADSMRAEPKLTGYIQADAAYFMKYVRPGNVGTGAALASRRDQKNAGLDPDGKTKATVSPRMHALVVFVQSGPLGQRRYKVAVVKTENQVDLLTLGKEYCDRSAALTTDGHAGYNFFTGAFQQHLTVDHSTEFYSADGLHTNLAEGFFSRMRSAEAGAWHKMTLNHIEDYGWEFAWRQTMAGRTNLEQLKDLLARLMRTGRSERFADYWGKSQSPTRPAADPDGESVALEVQKDSVPKKRGRPIKGSVRPQGEESHATAMGYAGLKMRRRGLRGQLAPGAAMRPSPVPVPVPAQKQESTPEAQQVSPPDAPD